MSLILKDLLLNYGNDYTIEQIRNIYDQKQSANDIENLVKEITSLITSSLNIQLNIGQYLTINTSQTFMTFETLSIDSLENKIVKQVGNAQFQLPSNFNLNTTDNSSISLQVSRFFFSSFLLFDCYGFSFI
jgi:hypothetical protein